MINAPRPRTKVRVSSHDVTRTAPSILLALAALRQGTGCVDPKTDYEDYLARVPTVTFDAGASDANTSAVPCSTILAGNGSGTFYGACLTSASAGDPSAAIYAVLHETVAVNPGGATGQMTISQAYLQEHPTNVSQTVNAFTDYPALPISSDCTYVFVAGDVTIPGAANSDMVDLVLTGTTYLSKLLSDNTACAAFSATLTAPISLDLTKGGSYCAFQRAPADGTITPFTLADFTCPGAPPAPVSP
jgi:hypothetical protein